MIESVFTLNEAMQWFLTHSDGVVRCVSESWNCEKIAFSFEEAQKFYENKEP